MQTAPIPGNEAERLAHLMLLGVLDTPPEALYDQLAQAAAAICETPMALVTLVDADRQWFKANIGLTGTSQTSRDISFCAHTILGPELMEVGDAQQDARFVDNPLVLGDPGIRFYAGVPLTMPDGVCVGSLCVLDRTPRTLTPPQRGALVALGQSVALALQKRETRNKLARQLATIEENYRLVIDHQTELVSLAQLDGTLVFVNEAYATYFGASPQDMVGRNLFDYILPEDREGVRQHLQWASEEIVRTDGVNRMTQPDGRIRWVAWTNRLLPARDGRPALIHSVGRDITAQRAAEEALRESEQRYRQLYESTPAMLHSIDRDGNLLSVSDAWLEKLEYTREEVIGRPSASFLTPQSRQRAIEHELPAFFRSGISQEVPYEYVTKSGKRIDVLLSAVMEYAPDGTPTRSIAVLQDVSDKRAAGAQLRLSAHLLQLVMDNVPARISYWTNDYRNIFANRAFQRAFKCEGENLAGRHTWEVMGQAWWDQIKQVVDRALAGEEQWMEVSSTDAHGVRTDTELRIAPNHFEDKIPGVFVIALDVTARRLAEELRHEQLVRQQLERDAQALHKLLNERSDMLNVLAHEVRQPINNASAALQWACRALQSAGTKEGLEPISKAQTVLYDVQNSVSNILAVSTQLGNQSEPMCVDLDLDMLLSISVADMPGNMQWRVEVLKHTDVVTLQTDASLLRLALRNLMKNALDFSPSDAPVKVEVRDGVQGYDLIIDVVDQGCGIESSLIPRLFERHVHGHHLGRVSHGLGLYIVKQAVTRLRGEVQMVETGPSGTRMRLCLRDGLSDDPAVSRQAVHSSGQGLA